MSNTVLGKSLSKLYELYCENGGRVTTDSRTVRAEAERREGVGPVFFALKGEQFDGNDYAVQAVADGAVAAVVHDKLPKGVKADSEEAARYIVVKDTLAALQELAAHHREVLGLPVLALTGSNGKTTTKELITRVLRTKYRVACTRGNLNNHIGVPLTLLSITDEDDVAVVEMGANHQGEIAALCAIARPDMGLITNVGRAHLEGFGGPEGVRLGKGELYDYLAQHGGTAFYAADDGVLSSMAAERFGATATGVAVAYRAESLGVSAAAETPNARLCLRTDRGTVETGMTGRYNWANVAAALAVGDYFGVDTEAAVKAIAAYHPDNNRSQVAVSIRGTGNVLYMDAYNANPSSMSAALDNFLELPMTPDEESGKVVILGDMRELGDYAGQEHEVVITRLLHTQQTNTDALLTCYLVGSEFGKAWEAVQAKMEEEGDTAASHSCIKTFPDAQSLLEALQNGAISIRQAQVLIKGSRGMALETLYSAL